jgi:predicted aspartyl protease
MLAAILALSIAAAPASAPPAVARIDDLGNVVTTIDGKGPYHFLVDTGAGITVITPQAAQRMGLVGGRNIQANGMGGSVRVRTLELRSVRVGRAVVNDVAAAIIPLPPDFTYQGDYGTIDGVLGYSFLKHFAVTIDLRNHRLTLTSPKAYRKAPGATSVAANFTGGTPLVAAAIDGVPGTFQLDTGDNGYVLLGAAYTAAHEFAKQYPKSVPMIFEGVGGMQHGAAIRVKNFTIGGKSIPNELATLSFAKTGVMSASALAGNVGVDVLRRFAVTIDYAHDRVDLVPNAALRQYVPFHYTGAIATRQAQGTFRVLAVAPNSAAAKAGIESGDVFVDLNDYPLARLDDAQIKEAIQAASIRYTLRTPSGRTRNVTLQLTDVLAQ